MRYNLKVLLLIVILVSVPLAIYAHRQYQRKLHWQPFNARRFDEVLDAGRDALVLVGSKPRSPWISHDYSGKWRFHLGQRPKEDIRYQIDTPEFCQFVNRRRVAMFYVESNDIDVAVAKKLHLPKLHTGELVEHVAIYLPTARKHEIVLYNPTQYKLIEMLSLAYKKPMQVNTATDK